MAVALATLLTVLLCIVTFVQTLYLESMRLLKRDSAALEYFRESLQSGLGFETEHGALTFSLIKHTLLVAVGATYVVLSRSALIGFEGFLLGFAAMMAAGYAVPQILYRRTSGRWLAPLTPILHLLGLLVKPLVVSLNWLEQLFELSNGHEEPAKPAAPGDNIEALITAGEEEGILEKEDSRLIQQVVAFGDKRVREVMTPRPNVVAISFDRSLEDLRQLVIHEQYSRIPVFEGDIDHIVGFVHVRDMFELDPARRSETRLVDLMRPIEKVPETKFVSALFKEMQKSGTHIVYVVDEYGNSSGIVTMEDLVEEIVGEIRDEHEPADDIKTDPDGSVIVSGNYDLDHLQDLFNFRPANHVEATTVGGLVLEWLGDIPKPGQTVERDGLRMEVLAANETRVERVRIQPA